VAAEFPQHAVDAAGSPLDHLSERPWSRVPAAVLDVLTDTTDAADVSVGAPTRDRAPRGRVTAPERKPANDENHKLPCLLLRADPVWPAL